MIVILRKKVIIMSAVMLLAAAVVVSTFAGKDVPIFSNSNAKIIVLDPGHGDPDGGAVGHGGTVESTLNLAVAKKVKRRLEKKGFTVIMTRKDENGIFTERSQSIREKKKEDMYNRLDIANGSGADLFISIHMNMFQDSKYRGGEVLYSDKFENAVLLAELIQSEIIAIDPDNQTRTAKKADGGIFLLKNAQIPAVLVECGFISNPDEEKLLSSKEYQDSVADAICSGVEKYYRSIDGRKDAV